jgi:hypothetical protein
MKKLGLIAFISPRAKLAYAAFAFLAVSATFASVPPTGRTTNDTAVYQSTSEITVPRQGRISFDDDLQRLNQMEPRFHERLPKLADRPELKGPIHRISTKKYVPSARRQKAGRVPRRHKPVVEKVDPASPASQAREANRH